MGHASIAIQRRIEWSDTDASGHYHNTAAFRMFEWAETALFEALGILQDVYGRLPRAHIRADFKGLLWHRDIVEIELHVKELGASSITYDIEIRRGPETCVAAVVVAVLVGAGRRPDRWSDEYRALLLSAGPQPAERLVSDIVGASEQTGTT
jgi:2-aminobenzoate-CoA ligase